MLKAVNKVMPLVSVMALVFIGPAMLPSLGHCADLKIDPRAERILKTMCDYLAELEQIAFVNHKREMHP